MDNYRTNEKRKPLLMKIAGFLFVVAALATSSALMLSYLANFMSPYTYWYIAFLGLMAPLLMLANIVFLLILGIRLSRWAIVPLVAFVLGIGYIGEFIQVSFVTKYDKEERSSNSEIKILTYNVHGFTKYSSGGHLSSMDSIARFVNEQNPDVICFQEFQLMNAEDHELIVNLFSRWKYRVTSYIVDDAYHKWGLAVFSKLPLKGAVAIKFSDRENSSMYVDILLREDTVRLFNNHLQSTQFNNLDKKALREEAPEQAARVVGRTLRDNYKVRVFQADTIRAIIDQSPHPTVVVGDFNDTPISYVYNKIRGDLSDTFCNKGEGYEYTYKRLMKLFRIDYILHSKSMKTLTHDSPDVPWSDHNPVVSKIKLKK